MANNLKIQSLKSLREEMVAVARGERPAPPNANVRSFNSLETVARLLTKENRKLLSLIRDSNPKSVSRNSPNSVAAHNQISLALSTSFRQLDKKARFNRAFFVSPIIISKSNPISLMNRFDPLPVFTLGP